MCDMFHVAHTCPCVKVPGPLCPTVCQYGRTTCLGLWYDSCIVFYVRTVAAKLAVAIGCHRPEVDQGI
jgi:hypothetical protein